MHLHGALLSVPIAQSGWEGGVMGGENDVYMYG